MTTIIAWVILGSIWVLGAWLAWHAWHYNGKLIRERPPPGTMAYEMEQLADGIALLGRQMGETLIPVAEAVVKALAKAIPFPR